MPISCIATSAAAQDVSAKVDEYMTAGANRNRFSSAVLVASNGKVLVSKGYGMSDYELGLPLNSKPKFRIASLTKQFTAAPILMLQERGKLKVGDPICKYMAKCPPAWERITIHQLFTHTSGLPNFMAFPSTGKRERSRR